MGDEHLRRGLTRASCTAGRRGYYPPAARRARPFRAQPCQSCGTSVSWLRWFALGPGTLTLPKWRQGKAARWSVSLHMRAAPEDLHSYHREENPVRLSQRPLCLFGRKGFILFGIAEIGRCLVHVAGVDLLVLNRSGLRGAWHLRDRPFFRFRVR